MPTVWSQGLRSRAEEVVVMDIIPRLGPLPSPIMGLSEAAARVRSMEE